MTRLFLVFACVALLTPDPAHARKKNDDLGGIVLDEIKDYLKNGTPESVCERSWISGSDLGRCVNIASTGVFDIRAVKVCHGLWSNKVECLEAIKDKTYGFAALRACESSWSDSTKLDCLRQNGTPAVAARDANEKVKSTILQILWGLLEAILNSKTSTTADAKDAQRAHLLKMIGEIKGTKPDATHDGVISPDNVERGRGEDSLISI